MWYPEDEHDQQTSIYGVKEDFSNLTITPNFPGTPKSTRGSSSNNVSNHNSERNIKLEKKTQAKMKVPST